MKSFQNLKKPDNEMFVHFILLLYCVSTGELQPKTIFKIGSNSGYGFFSKKFDEIYNLALSYNYGLGKASEIVSQSLHKSQSEYNRFLVRVSQIINLGENLSEYLYIEVDLVLQNFSSDYNRNVESIKTLLAMFTAIMSVSSFVVATTSILNMISGTASGMMFAMSLSLVILSLSMFVFVMYIIFPRDKIVNSKTVKGGRIKILIYIATAVSAVIIIESFLIDELPNVLGIVIAGIPFLIPGLKARKLENSVKKLDIWYPVFVKDFGNVYTTIGTVSRALTVLMRSDFNILTPHLKKMLNRSENRVNHKLLLDLFAHESSSEMIRSGNVILHNSLEKGANLALVGQSIHNVFSKINELRKIRDQTSKSFLSMVFVLHVLALIVFALITKVTFIFTDMFLELDGFESPFKFSPLDPILVSSMLPIILISLSIINALAIKIGEGGYYKTSFLYLGLLLIVGGLTLFIADVAISEMLSDQTTNLRDLNGG